MNLHSYFTIFITAKHNILVSYAEGKWKGPNESGFLNSMTTEKFKKM